MVLLRDEAEVDAWPLWVDRLDLSVVQHLARVQLDARLQGCSIQLRQACPHLLELLDLVGLRDVVPARVLGQVGRQAEEREEGGGVEEVVVTDDPVA